MKARPQVSVRIRGTRPHRLALDGAGTNLAKTLDGDVRADRWRTPLVLAGAKDGTSQMQERIRAGSTAQCSPSNH